ncbi:glycoside hydrolase family 108 protein [Nostoc sp.]|uniref:glycoside hydrolase family 108 protein n=1 Tax=Nostoc sp. TaxID=1180 RepID=UPI002FF7AE17
MKFLKKTNFTIRHFYHVAMAIILCTDIISFIIFVKVEFQNTQATNYLQLSNKIQQNLESQAKEIQQIFSELSHLKKSQQNLNQKLSKELVFREGLKFILAAEGGTSDDKDDFGGLTNLGITHTEYAVYRTQKGMSPRSVREISSSEARDIYKHYYWLNSGCDYPPRRVAIACLDWQVNSGRGFSTLQQVLGITADGIPGHQTLNELDYWLNKGNENKLLKNYFDIREADYRRWGVGNQRIFFQGWINRLNALKKYLDVS